VPSFKLKSSWVTILQGVEFSIFVLILAWALRQCSATALPVIMGGQHDGLLLSGSPPVLYIYIRMYIFSWQIAATYQNICLVIGT